ncbi:DNA repair protein RadA [Burkholderiales bacterium]|nr:DNA repair protein RadA [Burkholderiales bacterium]
MAKDKTLYSCSACGGQSPKWAGQCPHCGEWNTLVESVASATTRFVPLADSPQPGLLLPDIPAVATTRHATGMAELDRVLGGGWVPGAVILLGGDPGIGKSTLLLQTLAIVAAGRKTLYVTGEESLEQIAMRAQRLGLAGAPVEMLAEIQLERILGHMAESRPEVAVVDSIQTIYSDALQSAPGSVGQVRECAAQLTRQAKRLGIATVLVGHVTKDGAIAGPRVLEHIVDTVLYFEGDTHSNFRLVRAIKNRYGPVNELGVFAMTERGLREVGNPSALFLSGQRQPVPGSCVVATLEGTRPLLVEVQALVDTVQGGIPRRLSVGLEPQRLALLLAVLHRHGGIDCGQQDVFVNAVGGVRISEPAADLAVSLAVYSSLINRPLQDKLIVFGEIGLTGEIRPVQRGQERLKEAAKMGFTRALIPNMNKPKQRIENMTIQCVDTLLEAIQHSREHA